MEPIRAGALTIWPFGLFVAVLLLPFFLAVSRGMRKRGLAPGTASWFALLAVPLCFVLSRLGFCLFAVDQITGSGDFGFIFRVRNGGFLLWGAVAGLLLCTKLAGKITGESGALIADAAVVPACLMIAAVRLLCGLLFEDIGIGFQLDAWFDPEETDYAYRFSLFPLEDWSFFERFPFSVEDYYGSRCWAVFVLQALSAALIAVPLSRSEYAPGGRTLRFIVLYACVSLSTEAMLIGGEIVYLPWLAFVKANEVLCAAALLVSAFICLHRLAPPRRLPAALLFFPQLLASFGIIAAMEFAAFEKKLTVIEWLPADACHLITGLACLWIALAFRPLCRRAYLPDSGVRPAVKRHQPA